MPITEPTTTNSTGRHAFVANVDACINE